MRVVLAFESFADPPSSGCPIPVRRRPLSAREARAALKRGAQGPSQQRLRSSGSKAEPRPKAAPDPGSTRAQIEALFEEVNLKPLLLDCLMLEDAPGTVLRELVRQIDTAYPALDAKLALARAFLPIASALIEQNAYASTHPARATLQAAEAYLAAPSEDAWDHCVAMATSSYPFGPGDGCYSVSGHARCEPGSGCRSGAGTLVIIASTLGEDVALDTIRFALAPWLQG